MRRLFIAINIPEDIKSNIAKKNDVLESLLPGARYTGKENWHLTIVFLGWQPDEAVMPIIEAMNETVKKFSAPEISFSDISYTPADGAPRMVWLNGSEKTSKSISPLKEFLEDSLLNEKVRFKLENRKFNSHVTLNRFSDISKKDLPELGEKFKGFNWQFMAGSLDLMESHLSRGGSRYEILQRVEFDR
jgi:2'-5' RNA ligase